MQTHDILIEQAERLLYTTSHFINEDSRLGKPRACKDMMDKYCFILQVKKEILDRLGLSTSPGDILNSRCLRNRILFQIKQNHVTISFSMKSC